MIWRQEKNWTYEVFDLDLDAEDVPHHASFLEIWQKKKGKRALPLKSDFSFGDFRGWWGWVTISEVLDPSGDRIRYRLWGSGVADLTRLEMTGKTMQEEFGDRLDGSNFNDLDLELIKEVVTGRRIGRQSGPLNWEMPNYTQMSTLRLPVSRAGDQVDFIFSAVIAS